MITFNIDCNTKLVDFIYIAHWPYYRQNNELLARIFNILEDLTQGSFSSEQTKDLIARSAKGEAARVENDNFIVKSIINKYDGLKIAVFAHNKNFDTLKFDITPDIEQTIRAQFGIK